MNDRIQQVLTQMAALEDELRDALHEQETRMLFEIKGRRVEFEHTIKQAHRIIGIHSRYRRFLDYGEAADYAARVEAFRVALGRMK